MAHNNTSSSSNDNEKVTFGAVINDMEPTAATTQESKPLTTPAAPTPFYSIPSAQPSLQSLPSKKEPTIAVYEADLESGLQANAQDYNNITPLHSNLDLPQARPVASYATTAMTGFRTSFDERPKECTVWPTKETLREKAKAQKAKERQTTWCGGLKTKWESMTKKQRLMYRSLVLLTIVALAVGLGIGISRAVGGGVWSGKGESHTIPEHQ